jgi:hypothetical protein
LPNLIYRQWFYLQDVHFIFVRIKATLSNNNCLISKELWLWTNEWWCKHKLIRLLQSLLCFLLPLYEHSIWCLSTHSLVHHSNSHIVQSDKFFFLDLYQSKI